jgi:hypothetical protein
MSEPRLSAGIEASAFLRRAEQEGGFGTVLHKGDAERGSILMVVVERGEYRAILERRLQAGGTYGWAASGPGAGEPMGAAQYVARARCADPDCWVLELDIPSAERFIAETITDA